MNGPEEWPKFKLTQYAVNHNVNLVAKLALAAHVLARSLEFELAKLAKRRQMRLGDLSGGLQGSGTCEVEIQNKVFPLLRPYYT